MKDPGGYLLGQGIAPQAKLFATKVFRNDPNYERYYGMDTSNRTMGIAGAGRLSGRGAHFFQFLDRGFRGRLRQWRVHFLIP